MCRGDGISKGSAGKEKQREDWPRLLRVPSPAGRAGAVLSRRSGAVVESGWLGNAEGFVGRLPEELGETVWRVEAQEGSVGGTDRKKGGGGKGGERKRIRTGRRAIRNAGRRSRLAAKLLSKPVPATLSTDLRLKVDPGRSRHAALVRRVEVPRRRAALGVVGVLGLGTGRPGEGREADGLGRPKELVGLAGAGGGRDRDGWEGEGRQVEVVSADDGGGSLGGAGKLVEDESAGRAEERQERRELADWSEKRREMTKK
jgi:hypothetical protein